MSAVFYLELNDSKRNKLADILKVQRNSILHKWGEQEHVQNILNTKKIDLEFFMRHFGSRVLDYFISVSRGDKEPGQCPVIIVMLKFLAQHCLQLDDIYHICSGKRNAVIHTLLENGIVYSDDIFTASVEMFDANFSGVIREYNNIIHDAEYIHHCNIGKTCSVVENEIILPIDVVLLGEYFAKDNDDGAQKVLFRTEDADDMLEYFSEVSERLSLAVIHSDLDEIRIVADIFSRVSSILLHYSPFLDALAASMSELSMAMYDHTEEFMNNLMNCEEGMLRLFDAVSADMDRYIERFSIHSIAMKNSHHIHEPTMLSIRQIITIFAPDNIDAGEIEFF